MPLTYSALLMNQIQPVSYPGLKTYRVPTPFIAVLFSWNAPVGATGLS